MELTSHEAAPQALSARPCEHCGTPNGPAARFCKQCGSALVPPVACPGCAAEVARDARFCARCGVKLVGPRTSAEGAAAPRASARADEAPGALPAPASADAKRELDALAASLPRAKPRSSNILGNVLLFVAALSVFGVVMYKVNRDAPKEISPFMGGPAPRMGGGGAPAEGGGPAAAEGGAPIEGSVRVADALAKDAPQGGALFVIVRAQGMPDKGPPVAVKRLESPSFPASFQVGPSDVMMQGLGFVGPFDVYVRLDADGNAMTKQPGDLTGMKSGVNAGERGVELVLDKRL